MVLLNKLRQGFLRISQPWKVEVSISSYMKTEKNNNSDQLNDKSVAMLYFCKETGAAI